MIDVVRGVLKVNEKLTMWFFYHKCECTLKQCKSLTERGVRCKNHAVDGKEYCVCHMRCQSFTLKGYKCKNSSVDNTRYCKIHGK